MFKKMIGKRASKFKFNLRMFDTTFTTDMAGLIPTEQSEEIIQAVIQGSAVMQLAKYEPMTKATKTFPVLLSGPGAYWVGEGERIKTSKAVWADVTLVAKKMGVIVPFSKEALQRPRVDVLEELKPKIAEAFYQLFDLACLLGAGSPFQSSVVAGAKAAGNEFVRGSIAEQNLGDDVNALMGLIEADDLDPNGHVTHRGLKQSLRGMKDAQGTYVYASNTRDGVAEDTLQGLPLTYAARASWDKNAADLITGDWDKAYFSILQDIEYEILKEATLHTVTAADGKPLSLAEQDMVALKATFHVAFLNTKDEAFAVLRPKGYVAPVA